MIQWADVINTFIWLIIGLVFFAVGYKVLDFITPFRLNKEIDEGNTAAGITVAGMFIAIGLIIAALIR